MCKTIGMILAGGIGIRFNGTKPKQYYLINDKEVIWYSIQAFRNSKFVDDFIVVLDEQEFFNRRIATNGILLNSIFVLSRQEFFRYFLDIYKFAV